MGWLFCFVYKITCRAMIASEVLTNTSSLSDVYIEISFSNPYDKPLRYSSQVASGKAKSLLLGSLLPRRKSLPGMAKRYKPWSACRHGRSSGKSICPRHGCFLSVTTRTIRIADLTHLPLSFGLPKARYLNEDRKTAHIPQDGLSQILLSL
jgi:hypothetical protein